MLSCRPGTPPRINLLCRASFGLALLLNGLVWCETSLAENDDSLVNMIIQFMGDESSDVRALAFEQIRSAAPGRRATRAFADELSKLPPDGQVGLLGALAVRGDKAARDAVVDRLSKSPDEKVRVAAIEALGTLGEASDLPRLIELVEAGTPSASEAARNSLVRIQGDSIARALANQIEEAPPPLAAALIEILATRRALETIGDILDAAAGEDPQVRAAAMTALGQIAGPEHIPGMAQGVLKAESSQERAAAEKAIMFVCNRIEDPEKRAEPLLATMQALDEDDRLVLLSTLGRVGGAAALTSIRDAIGDADPEVHQLGIGALCQWPNASVEGLLLELAQSEEHADHRRMALRALIRVAPLRDDDRTDAHRLDLLRQAMKMCEADADRQLVLRRAAAVRTVDALRFLTGYIERPRFTELACKSVLELAHHRSLREPNKAEFDRVLDQVIANSKDTTTVERAKTYKAGKTWYGPR